MSQMSKCPKVTVILSYWEASEEVSKLRYKSLLYCASVGSYCSIGEGRECEELVYVLVFRGREEEGAELWARWLLLHSTASKQKGQGRLCPLPPHRRDLHLGGDRDQ